MTPGTSEAGRRVLLHRVYREYETDPAFAQVRSENGGFLVPGDGPMSPRYMFVGEAPGKQEARLRKPFVGPSGHFLNELLVSVGLDREDVFITNVVKYRPLDNRDPTAEEREAGRSYLWREHALLGYPPIVMLGRHAARAIGAGEKRVGEWQYVSGSFAPVLALHHPAYGIYQRGNRPRMFQHFRAVLTPPSPQVRSA